MKNSNPKSNAAKHEIRPASSREAGLFYAPPPEQVQEMNQARQRVAEAQGQNAAPRDGLQQSSGLTEKGRQTLQNTADPGKAHTYSWYVIENINSPELCAVHDLPLEEAVRLYAGLDCGDKRLGVTKDDIAAVDLLIRWEGREWLSEDRLKQDSFKDDPVVADAAAQLQQMLESAPEIDRAGLAGGEPETGMMMGGMS